MRLVAICLCLGLLVGGASAQSSRKKPKKHPGQLRQDLNKVRSKKQAIKKELVKVKQAVNTVKVDIVQVNNDLDQVEEQLSQTTDRLERAKLEATIARKQLTIATQKLAASSEQVRVRIKRIYMQGDAQVVSALIGNMSVGEIATRKFLFERIAEKDHKIFTEFKKQRSEVAERKKHLDEIVTQVANLAGQQKSQQQRLVVTKKKKEVYLSELKDRVDDLQAALRQFEADEAAIAAQIRAFIAAQKRSGKTIAKFTGRFGMPISARMTSGFGMRFHPILHRVRLHAGCDFGAPIGTPIRAAADGVVVSAGNMRGYGRVVIIQHGDGLSTVYAHCSRVFVGSGTVVKRGQSIAAVGSSGLSTGPHLHFEVRKNGTPVNPLGRF